MTAPAACPSCRKPLPADAPEGMCPECMLRAGFETGGRAVQADAPALAADDVARRLPQFEILGPLGRGGMGVVWRARQRALDREVALKVLSPEAAAAPGFAERFRREAKALARLDHPNIVRVHDSGEADGVFWLAMERVEGTNLRQAMSAAAVKPHEALAIVRQICDALEYAHAHGVVHRDIKPENVLISSDGRVRVADFGIAKIAGDAPGADGLTAVGQVVGTAHYMAPEQIEHPATVDHRADIYSLGVVFYELLTGELPLGRFAPPSAKVEIDVRLDEIVLRTLAKEREARYQRAVEVRSSVDAIGTGERAPRAAADAPRGWTGSWAAVGVSVAFAAAMWGLGISTRWDGFAVPLVAWLVAAVWVSGRAVAGGRPWTERTPANRSAWMAAGAAVVADALLLADDRLVMLGGAAVPLGAAGTALTLVASTWSPSGIADPARPRRHPLVVRGIGCLALGVGASLVLAWQGSPAGPYGPPPVGMLLALFLPTAGWAACLLAVVLIVRSRGAWTGLALAISGVAIPVVVPAVVAPLLRSRIVEAQAASASAAAAAARRRTLRSIEAESAATQLPYVAGKSPGNGLDAWLDSKARAAASRLDVRGGPASLTDADRRAIAVALADLWKLWQNIARGCDGDLGAVGLLYPGDFQDAIRTKDGTGVAADAASGARGLPMMRLETRGCAPSDLIARAALLADDGLHATIEATSPRDVVGAGPVVGRVLAVRGRAGRAEAAVTESAGSASFATTRWTVVAAAGSADTGEAREALGALCRAYWYPLYCFARRRGADAPSAQDLVQGFFAKLVEGGAVGSADRARGRFRTFLLASFRNFAADEHDRDVAAKRGGGAGTPSLDIDFAEGESRFLAEPSHDLTPERVFERRWALDLLAAALRRTRADLGASDEPALGGDLLPFVGGPGDGAPYAEIAARHGTTEGAVKTAVHRLRRRYREHLRALIRDTVSSDAEVESEIRDLLAAVAVT